MKKNSLKWAALGLSAAATLLALPVIGMYYGLHQWTAAHTGGIVDARFIALVDECYDRRVPLYIEAEVALDELYTQGYLGFAFRRTLSRLREMQLQRFGAS